MNSLADFARRIRTLVGWRRPGAATLAGAATVLGLAPFHLWPVLFVSLPVLVWLIDGSRAVAPGHEVQSRASSSRWRGLRSHPAARAATITWWFAFGYFLAGLFWIGEAFLVEAEKFAVLIPFAVTLMPAGLALFWAAAAALASFAWRPGFTRLIALALALSIAEWLRGHVLTGFPWNILGYALTYPLPLMQSATIFGIYGLTLLAVPIFAAPAVILGEGSGGRPLRGAGLAAILVGVVPILTMLALGSLRLAGPDPAPAENFRLRLVQPSIPQRQKWRPENQERIFLDHIALSRRQPNGLEDGARGLQLIVWPEAAMPFLPLNSPGALAAIGRLLPEGVHLLSGALRVGEPPAHAAGPTARRLVYNSLLVFGAGGRPIAHYDKIQLVPFGEYLPFQTALEAIGLEQLSRLRGGFAAGRRPRPLLTIPGLPALGPLVCYEAIFPGALVEGTERPAALINVTNDGWFGNTTGPRQHLHQARVRAVEEGMPLLRAANNGISAVIDAKGRISHRLELDQQGVIDANLPGSVAPPLYARYGDWIFLLMLGLAAGLLGVLLRGSEPLGAKVGPGRYRGSSPGDTGE